MDANSHAVVVSDAGRVETRHRLVGSRRALTVAFLLSTSCMFWAMAGCSKSNYGVDLRNRTPQPVYAQLVERMNSGEQRARVGARLGPGDRAGVGPVRARTGSVTLIVDTMPNPGVPAMVELAPGTSSIEVTQDGEGTSGPIRLRELR